jgi:hypothetical protein
MASLPETVSSFCDCFLLCLTKYLEDAPESQHEGADRSGPVDPHQPDDGLAAPLANGSAMNPDGAFSDKRLP